MRRWPVFGAVALALALIAAVALSAGDWGGRAATHLPCRRNFGWLPSYLPRSSPTRSLVFEVGATRVKVCSGQPRLRGGRMIGGTPVPYGRLWRTGANEPTTIRTSGPLVVAGLDVPAGKVALYTVPGPQTWEVILNRSTAQWGLESEYSPEVRSAEIGRAIATVGRVEDPVEALRFRAEPDSAGHVDLVLEWEHSRLRIQVQEPVR